MKYKKELIMMAICMYLENMGLRNIGRILKVPYQLISKWVKSESFNIKKSEETKEIEVLEIDELVTYLKKIQKSVDMDCCLPKQEQSY